MRWNYYKLRQLSLLQSAMDFTNCDSFFITKCDTVYYKLRQVLQSAMDLLQISTGITKCDDYYKLRQYRCYSYWTSSTTSPNACLCFGHQKYFCVQSETSAHLSHCVRDLLTQRSWPANSTAPPTPRIRPLAGAGKLSSRRVFSENKPPKFTLQVSFDSLVSSRRKA